jgi:hypothetical protein
MNENVTFPVYVLAKDCGEVTEYSSRDAMQSYLEAIDVENEEYEAWDFEGRVVKLIVADHKPEWLNLVHTQGRLPAYEFTRLRTRAKLCKG